jgi:hypothetical protein
MGKVPAKGDIIREIGGKVLAWGKWEATYESKV